MSFLERSRLRGITLGHGTFHHPDCVRIARFRDAAQPAEVRDDFADCCLHRFYRDEQRVTDARRAIDFGIDQLRRMSVEYPESAHLFNAAIGELKAERAKPAFRARVPTHLRDHRGPFHIGYLKAEAAVDVAVDIYTPKPFRGRSEGVNPPEPERKTPS